MKLSEKDFLLAFFKTLLKTNPSIIETKGHAITNVVRELRKSSPTPSNGAANAIFVLKKNIGTIKKPNFFKNIKI